MSIRFANGDVYAGNCVLFDGGEKRHGAGVYSYSNGTHMTYKQYRGQWREDKKHGFGVLLFRNGGVYAGQWENNQKHGLGVLFDNTSEDTTQMPAFRYEGQWHNDQPHGLGAEETDQCSAYYGRFVYGKRQGRGVKMNLMVMGAGGTEVIDESGLSMPLLDALEAETVRLACHDTTSGAARSSPGSAMQELAPETRRRLFSDPRSEHESGSSGKTSGDTRSPMSARMQHSHQHGGLDAEQATPLPGNAGHMPTSWAKAAPVPVAAPGAASSSGRQPHPPRGGFAREQIGGSTGSRVRSVPARPKSPAGSVLSEGGGTVSGDGSEVVFSMWEENGLLSPESRRVQMSPTKWEHSQKAGANHRDWRVSQGPMARQETAGGRLLSEGNEQGSSGPPVANSSTSSSATQPAPSQKEHRSSRVRSVILWSEDELATFMTFLGIGADVRSRVQQHRLKGVGHLLEMSDSELRRQFGLTTPVERIIVRQSLKRLLDSDRWENSVRGQKVGDILNDLVLAKFSVPSEELTLLSKISQGGYGTVFRGALEPSVDRGSLQAHRTHLVAVKEMKGERKVRLYELLKEACVMASLRHPNICQFIGVCSDASARKHYIISELMDCSLFDLIHQPHKLRWHGELTVSLVASVSEAICAGVAYLHAMKLVHADMKSSNILIDYSSSWQLIPRICDFGHLAVRAFPSPHHRCGTPHWASPEVLRGEALGPAADMYSFGAIMWEMLTQKLPHKGMSFGQVLASVGWAGSTPDLALLPDIPPEKRRLVKECLSFSPSDRPGCKEAHRRLRRIPKQARQRALGMLAGFLG